MNEKIVLKVNDITNPIFEYLYNYSPAEFQWIRELWSQSPNYLTVGDYLYKIHSGDKWLSHRIIKIENSDNWKINRDYIYSMFARKWKTYWDTLNLEYIPNDNYRIERDEIYHARDSDNIIEKNAKDTIDDTKRNYESVENSKNKKNTDSQMNEKNFNSSINNEEVNNASSSAEQIYGFNSSNGTDSNRTDDRDITKTLTDYTNNEDNKSNSNTNENYSENKNKNDSERESKNVKENEHSTTFKDTTKSNKTEVNIHGLDKDTNQNLINQELELRKTLFLDVVFNDIDSFLTIPCY